MKILLTETEVRCLGALIEKSITTPDYYPMTLNALTNACNQKSNRDPVVHYTEETVARTLDSLWNKKLVTHVSEAGSRVRKYGHDFTDVFELDPAAVAVACTLMLRGPQTFGEIKGRCARMHEFATLKDVAQTLESLANHNEGALVLKLERQAGRKESRYAHLLAGTPEFPESEFEIPAEPATLAVLEENDRITKLENETAGLRRELEALRDRLNAFVRQFE